MRMGVPASSVNCLEGWGFFVFASRALGMGAIRVPRPAAGIITITFMAGCKYTRRRRESSNRLLGRTVTPPAWRQRKMPALLVDASRPDLRCGSDWLRGTLLRLQSRGYGNRGGTRSGNRYRRRRNRDGY